MRIEVDDEAARLRQREVPIRCQARTPPCADESASDDYEYERSRRKSVACDDCCKPHLACRCHPGEG